MLLLICPPLTGGSAILREDGRRQEWRPVHLTHHQLDYRTHEDLWPGWLVYEHEGRYLSTRSVQVLNWQALLTPEPAAA